MQRKACQELNPIGGVGKSSTTDWPLACSEATARALSRPCTRYWTASKLPSPRSTCADDRRRAGRRGGTPRRAGDASTTVGEGREAAFTARRKGGVGSGTPVELSMIEHATGPAAPYRMKANGAWAFTKSVELPDPRVNEALNHGPALETADTCTSCEGATLQLLLPLDPERERWGREALPSGAKANETVAAAGVPARVALSAWGLR